MIDSQHHEYLSRQERHIQQTRRIIRRFRTGINQLPKLHGVRICDIPLQLCLHERHPAPVAPGDQPPRRADGEATVIRIVLDQHLPRGLSKRLTGVDALFLRARLTVS